jgi:uncharacterized membrane protein YfcA
MRIGAFILLVLVGIYGGFFGAGMGIMLLAALSIINVGDYHAANALKNLIATVAQLVAVLLFSTNGLVSWPEAAITTVTCIAGGYLGVVAARQVPEAVVRAIVVIVGAGLTVMFFVK